MWQLKLNPKSGVPFYRQLIDQVLLGIASGELKPGDQLPTVRQAAVELAVNPNTVARAYKELEIRGILATQQGTGTFVAKREVERPALERQRQLDAMVDDFVARAAGAGFRFEELLGAVQERKQAKEEE